MLAVRNNSNSENTGKIDDGVESTLMIRYVDTFLFDFKYDDAKCV